uniref:DUF4378 domain-containing protein n=1 Tax=Setaria digitata TaxID=48799 RepID=A0A915PN18_9BILA
MDAPPAPPPPPPPIQSTSPFLSSGWRSSTDSNRQAHSAVPTSPKPTTPRLDAKTLQHAVAGLRKTEYGRSLQGDIENLSNGRLDGTDQQLSGRYRSNSPFDVSMGRNQTRAAFHASPIDTRDPVPVRNVHRHSDALNSTSYTERSTTFQQQPQNMPFSPYLNNQQYSLPHYQSSNGVIPRDVPYITDPQSYIRAYATQTPAYTVMNSPHDNYPTKNNIYYNAERRIPSSNMNKSYQFVKELRDQSLTKTQRIANQFQQSHLRDVPPPQNMEVLYKQREHLGHDQIDSLIRDMEWKLKTGMGAAGDGK